MFNPFSPNMVRPKLPLRKPLSSPMASATSASPRQLAMPDALVLPAGPVNSQIKDTSVLLPSTLPTERVYYCTYCGQQGHFRCKRCKKTPYCSVVCQTEDWMAHRRMCKPPDPEPVKEKPLETTVSPGTGNSPGVLGSKPGDASSHQKIFFKDLHIIKATKGTDIQANVVEFYSPGRFFILPQNSELMDVLQIISTELQKTYIFPPIATYIPCVGEVCAVQYSHDMNWYRGLVQTLDADQRMANILYIDFGNEEHVPLDRIQQLVINIQPFGPCAMECSIAGVEPVCGNWSAECSIALRKLLAGKTVTVKLVEKVEHSHIHAVDILLSMGKVSTFLIERGYAAQRAISITPTEQEIHAMIGVSLENFRRCSGGKDDNTWALPPEPLTQAVGDSFSVLITHLQSPNEFIVQKVENAGLIQKLQMKLREHCYQSAAPQNFRPAPGTVCCAQFSEDKQWYRAKVLAYSSEARVCVGYLDFGNSEEVDLGHLRPISPPLLAIPMQAIPCGLAGLQPVGENWSEECILALQRRVSNRILRIEIHGAHEGKALVALIDEASDPQANVAELLTSAGFSTPVTVTNSDEQADQKVAAAAELHALATSSDPLTWSWAELPCDSQTVALLACVVENPQDFYCHISNPKDLQQLTELGPELKKHCAANESLFVAKVGDPCCVMLPADEECYRAVVSVLSEDMVSVNLVDYGHRITLDKNNLRSITPRLLSLPFQAVHCSLADVEPLGSEWSIEALLRFQTLVDGETLSARALSVSERGYNVKLESRGQDVAATLISEHLAKAPGAVPKDTYVAFKSEAKRDEKIEESEDCTVHVEAPNQLGAVSKETATKVTAIKAEAPSFPVDWKTVELPVNETFQPCIAAVISPSLFYLLGPSQVDQQKRRQMMMELASYCSNNNFLSSSSSLSRPVPGAACCAKFSADNLWYRAVVLEVGENEMSVIYADYGNTENVPFSRILPIPMHLLQLPFQITRCTLTGNEHFPAEWPEEVQKLFKNLLSQKVLATVQSFDGSANVLSLTQCTESGGGQLTAMILGLLQAKRNPSPSTPPKAEDTDSTAVVAECRQPEPVPETQKGLEEAPATIVQTTTVELTPWTPQTNNSLAASFKEPQTPGCCCVSLKNKIDHLEELLQLQLCLIKQLLQQK